MLSILSLSDDKHIRLKKPENSGSQFYNNYKNFFSTILFGVVEADYCFIAIVVGSCGSIGDCNVFKNSNFGQRLQTNKLNIPNAQMLPYNEQVKLMPFIFVGDEAFALLQHRCV